MFPVVWTAQQCAARLGVGLPPVASTMDRMTAVQFRSRGELVDQLIVQPRGSTMMLSMGALEEGGLAWRFCFLLCILCSCRTIA